MPELHPESALRKKSVHSRSRFVAGTWLNLARKEWHEHKWEAAAITAIIFVCVAPALFRRVDVVESFGFVAMVAFVATIFVAMSIVAGERSDGSLGFVESLPVERWKVATVRLLAGGCLCVAPIFVAGTVAIAIVQVAGPKSDMGELLLVVIGLSGACVSLYFWITAVAIHQPSQFRVGVVGMLVLFGWLWLHYLFLRPPGLNPQPILPSGLIRIIEDLGPLGWLAGTVSPRASLMAWQPPVLGLLFAVSAANYGLPIKPLMARDTSRKTPLGSPRRSPRSAIVWLNAAEALPVAIGGAALLLAMAFGYYLAFAQAQPKVFIAGTRHALQPFEILSNISLGFGILWMAVVATTTFVPSLQPAILTFWRSRPISPSDWFWSKYWVGALIGIGFLHAPTVVAVSITRGREWVSPIGDLAGDMCILLTHLMVYSVAVLAACLLRHVVHASILGFAFAAFVVGIPATYNERLQVFRVGFAKQRITEFAENGVSTMGLKELDFVPFTLLMVVLVIGSAVVASHAVRRDVSYRP
jgi:hypothetical protein